MMRARAFWIVVVGLIALCILMAATSGEHVVSGNQTVIPGNPNVTGPSGGLFH